MHHHDGNAKCIAATLKGGVAPAMHHTEQKPVSRAILTSHLTLLQSANDEMQLPVYAPQSQHNIIVSENPFVHAHTQQLWLCNWAVLSLDRPD